MPTILHQLIVQFLFRLMDDFVTAGSLGHVLLAPLPVRLTAEKYREPDLMFVRPERITSLKGFPIGAELVMEVVSEGPDNRERDYVEKRSDYAAAGIAEYWIVDPQPKTITILSLDGNVYRDHGPFREGERASSVLLPGFAVDVRELFARPSTVR
jgi:Uma2 family endonuclease